MTSKQLQERLTAFAYRTIKVCEKLDQRKICRIVVDQLLRSAFSSAANYRACCRAISRKSFVSKLSIAFEEIDESFFWLEVTRDLELVKPSKLVNIIKEADELSCILGTARKTAQKNKKAQKKK